MKQADREPDGLYTADNFKICSLCGALNPVEKDECFVCGWRGVFCRDREKVLTALKNLKYEHGCIEKWLFEEEAVPSTPLKPGILTRLWKLVKKLFCRKQPR